MPASAESSPRFALRLQRNIGAYLSHYVAEERIPSGGLQTSKSGSKFVQRLYVAEGERKKKKTEAAVWLAEWNLHNRLGTRCKFDGFLRRPCRVHRSRYFAAPLAGVNKEKTIRHAPDTEGGQVSGVECVSKFEHPCLVADCAPTTCVNEWRYGETAVPALLWLNGTRRSSDSPEP